MFTLNIRKNNIYIYFTIYLYINKGENFIERFKNITQKK